MLLSLPLKLSHTSGGELRPNVGFSASREPFVAASTVGHSTVGQLEPATIRRYKSEAI